MNKIKAKTPFFQPCKDNPESFSVDPVHLTSVNQDTDYVHPTSCRYMAKKRVLARSLVLYSYIPDKINACLFKLNFQKCIPSPLTNQPKKCQ